MASLYIPSTPATNIEYSIMDGRVMQFTLLGKVLYDEDESNQDSKWKEKLVELVKDMGLDTDRGIGRHAFVNRMEEDGLIGDSGNEQIKI